MWQLLPRCPNQHTSERRNADAAREEHERAASISEVALNLPKGPSILTAVPIDAFFSTRLNAVLRMRVVTINVSS